MPITVLELAWHRGAEKDEDGATNAYEVEKTGLPFMGGCCMCGATVACYNACPSKAGYLKCLNDCIGDDGWDSVEEANRDIFDVPIAADSQL